MTASDGDAGAVWVFLVWFDFVDDHGVANFMPTVLRDVQKLDELEGICAFYALVPWAFGAFSNTLAETAEFVCIGGIPDSGKLGVFAQLSVL